MKNKKKLIGQLRSANEALQLKRTEFRSYADKGEQVPAELQAQYMNAADLVENLRSQIIEIEDDEITESLLASGANDRAQTNKEGRSSAEYRSAFSQYLRSESLADMSQEMRTKLNEMRAMNTGSNSDGGYLVDTETQKTVYEEQVTWGAIYALTKKINTERGNNITWPVAEEGLTRGVIIGEAQNHGKSETTFSSEIMGAHKISSRIILVSDELLQDSWFDIAAYVLRIARQRIELGMDYYLIHGSGNQNEPKGILLQIKQSKRISAKPTATAPGEVMDAAIDVIHGVDPAFRKMPGFGVAVNDNTLKLMRKWKDADGNPIYLKDPRADWSETLFGEKLIIDNELPDIGNDGWILAGDFAAITVRLVGAVAIRRLNELYAETGQVGFLAWQRFGVVLTDKAAMAAGVVNNAGTPDKFVTKVPADLSGQGDNVVVTNPPRDTSAKGSNASGTANDGGTTPDGFGE